MHVPPNPLILLGPSILLVFAICFLAFWISDKRHLHLLFFAIAGFLFCIGSLVQMLNFPADGGINAILSAFFYTLSVLLVCDGLLQRSTKKMPLFAYLVITSIILCGIAYYYYHDRDLTLRIYVLNYGFGLIFLYSLLNLLSLRRGIFTEKLLFWLLAAFTAQFFVRTALTSHGIPSDGVEFSTSIFWLTLQFSLAILGVAFSLALLAVVVSDKMFTLEQERAVDPLTNLLNRRGFTEQAEKLLSDEAETPISLLQLDIDYFKSINDTFGHPVGDCVLTSVAQIISKVSGPSAICARMGGEEFSVLVPRTGPANAFRLADKIRRAVKETHYTVLPAKRKITVSIGVATAKPHFTLDRLLLVADNALYAAKRSGRDRIESTSETVSKRREIATY